MVVYECYKCGYNNKDITKMRNHLNRKNICKSIRLDINLIVCKGYILGGLSYNNYLMNYEHLMSNNEHSPNITEKIHKSFEDLYSIFKCEYCNKKYKHIQSLNRHNKHCSIILQQIKYHKSPDNLVQILTEQLKIMQIELQNKDKQHTTQLKSKDKQINSLIKKAGNTTTNMTNTVNNIIINAYTKPDLSFITYDNIVGCIRKKCDAYPKLIEMIHFNIDQPQNHNIYISNARLNEISVYDGTKWIKSQRNNILMDLCNNCTTIYDEAFDDEEYSENDEPKILNKKEILAKTRYGELQEALMNEKYYDDYENRIYETITNHSKTLPNKPK
jgi:hypothetical protein